MNKQKAIQMNLSNIRLATSLESKLKFQSIIRVYKIEILIIFMYKLKSALLHDDQSISKYRKCIKV